MASGCGQADAAGPHLPSARGPLTPNVARDVGLYMVGGSQVRNVGDITKRAVGNTDYVGQSFHADSCFFVNAATVNVPVNVASSSSFSTPPFFTLGR